jgi:DNA-binding NtrC family response regulator
MKNIYLSWHLPTHGIHYTKNILAAFWSGKVSLDEPKMNVDGLNQETLEGAFDQVQNGFRFDKVYYLYPDQVVQDRIHTRSPKKKWDALKEDQLLVKSKTHRYWQTLVDAKNERLEDDLALLESTVKTRYPGIHAQMMKEYWRMILDYPIEDQLWWFRNLSNAKGVYDETIFETVNLSKQREHGIKDMRDYLGIGLSLKQFLTRMVRQHPKAQFVVNVSLGSYETQVVWFILAEARILPKGTRFIAVYDQKDDPHATRYKDFTIKEVRTDLLDELRGSFQLFPTTQSLPRQLANLKMEAYLKSGFAILLLGPRGVGKTNMVQENARLGKVIEANCAAFADDTMAESQLFGHEKGAFTGAAARHDGLFHEANGGILFLDEIHHLSKSVQGRLMTALQTDKDNNLRIRRLGGTKAEKVQCRIIMASNRSIKQLKEVVLPDFFDRIAQHVIEIPPLADTWEDREADWKAIWKQLRFQEEVPNERELIDWLKRQSLPGNFRDLQKIAIYYHTYLGFDEKTRKLIGEESAFEFARAEYEKYHLEEPQGSLLKFDASKTTTEMIKQFKFELAQWAVKRFGKVSAAEEHFQGLGDSLTRKTLHEWLRSKSIRVKPGES